MLLQKNIPVSCALAVLLLICSAASTKLGEVKKKWLILKECSVKVNGTTNVNKFTCRVPDYPGRDTITCLVSSNKVAMSGQVTMPVISFDCANAMMTGDLRKTLHAKEFPSFFIYFISLEKYPALGPAPEPVAGVVTIELAGVKKQLDIRYKISMDGHSIIRLEGAQTIHFSDFGLAAPRKLGGMIRASDQLDVEFTITCRLIGS